MLLYTLLRSCIPCLYACVTSHIKTDALVQRTALIVMTLFVEIDGVAVKSRWVQLTRTGEWFENATRTAVGMPDYSGVWSNRRMM